MTWGPDLNGPFMAAVGIFLLISSAVLFLLRDTMARSGVMGWAWLPERSKFKTYRAQRFGSIVSAVIVGLAGLVFLVLAMLEFWSR